MCGRNIEIVYNEQGVIFQRTEKTVVFPKTFFLAVFGQIIRKIQVSNRLM